MIKLVEYMEWIREDLTVGAGSYAEAEIAMPVGRSDNIICAIHEVWFAIVFTTPADALDAAGDRLDFCLCRKSQGSTFPQLNNPDVLDIRINLATHLGTNGQQTIDMVQVHHFYPPLMIANSKLYFGAYSTDAGTGYIRIGYTLRKVSRAELYDALVD